MSNCQKNTSFCAVFCQQFKLFVFHFMTLSIVLYPKRTVPCPCYCLFMQLSKWKIGQFQHCDSTTFSLKWESFGLIISEISTLTHYCLCPILPANNEVNSSDIFSPETSSLISTWISQFIWIKAEVNYSLRIMFSFSFLSWLDRRLS